MNKNYRVTHSLVAHTLLISLFLQSCRNPSNQLPPKYKERTDFITLLEGEEFSALGGNLVTFYQQNGTLQADIKVDEKQSIHPLQTNSQVEVSKANLYEVVTSVGSIKRKRSMEREKSIKRKRSKFDVASFTQFINHDVSIIGLVIPFLDCRSLRRLAIVNHQLYNLLSYYITINYQPEKKRKLEILQKKEKNSPKKSRYIRKR